MESGVVALDILQIRKQTDANRKLLSQDPDNLVARIRLAWCLFAEALYDSGRRVQDSAPGEPLPEEGAAESSAASTAEEALRHAVTAKLLSVRPEDRAEAERLEELIVSMADASATDRIKARVYHAMSELSADVFDSAVVNTPRPRKKSKDR